MGPLPENVRPSWRIRLSTQANVPDAFRERCGQESWTGVTERNARVAWVAIAHGNDGETLRRLRHELTHVILAAAGDAGADFPFWLQEGIPCCYEAGIGPLGRPLDNRARRRHLQLLLRTGRPLRLDRFLNKRADAPFSSNDYAVAWGLVYALATERLGREGRTCLEKCLRAAGRAARNSESATGAARRAFDSYLSGQGLTLYKWEKRWRRTVLHLGGLFD
ncbi:MAG: hypothetical protein GXP31_14930 [Kiritimatiellaeota bacterium]|nr:hypothetical protein [Kiritimatiellota bacterium]